MLNYVFLLSISLSLWIFSLFQVMFYLLFFVISFPSSHNLPLCSQVNLYSLSPLTAPSYVDDFLSFLFIFPPRPFFSSPPPSPLVHPPPLPHCFFSPPPHLILLHCRLLHCSPPTTHIHTVNMAYIYLCMYIWYLFNRILLARDVTKLASFTKQW